LRHAPRILVLLLAASSATLLALASGCHSDSKSSESARAHAPVLQFGVVAELYEQEDASEYEGSFDDVKLTSVRTFAIQDARVYPDPQGHPAVLFVIAESEREAFRQWTGSLVGKQMALILEGKVVATPRIKTPLPGAGVVMDETKTWTADEAESIAERIRAQAKPPGS
jgi:preprotein translocase subunit SecD